MRGLMSAVAALAIAGGAMVHAQDASTSEQAGPGAVKAASAYVMAAGQSDQFEIQEGKLAEQRAQSARVRAVGKQMVQDHTKSTEMVMAAATASGLPEMPPPPLRADQQQELSQLASASGPAFDRLYVQQQLASHREALTLQQGYSTGGADPNLRGAATKIVPVVQHHLGELEGLQTRV